MLQEFKTQMMSKTGIARSSKWVCQIFPPRGMTALGKQIGNLLGGGNKVEVNLPIFGALDRAQQQINNLNVNLGNVNVGFNPEIPPLGYSLSNMGDEVQAINLFCAGVEIPARDLQEIEYNTGGEIRSVAFMHSHDNLTVDYYCTEAMSERDFFERWQDIVYNRDDVSVGYYDDYISRLDVIKYNAGFSEITAKYRFNEVYPTNVGAIALDNEADTILKLSIQFKYRNYERID